MIKVPAAMSQSLIRRLALAALAFLGIAGIAAAAAAAPIKQIASYPPNGALRVAPEAELYFVFDQPTAKAGAFSVADLDSGQFGTLITLLAPRWSALGDTVFLKPSFPMRFGHRHGMKVNTIVAPDPNNSAVDLPLVLFNVAPRANVVRIGPVDLFPSLTLVPGTPVPVTIGVRETAGTAAAFTRVRYYFYAADEVSLSSGFQPVPFAQGEVPVSVQVPRKGTAALSATVTLSRDAARAAIGGPLGVKIDFEGYDETGLPYTFSATSRISVASPTDSSLVLARGLVTPAIGASIAVGSVFLEFPLPGAAIAAGDTLYPRAVVTGIGTGSLRGAFYMDGELVALAEGFLEAGRPDTLTTRGSLPTRRFGEHRLQFVVEAPQNVASAPITFLCVPPAHGISSAGGDAAAAPDQPAAGTARATLSATWMAEGDTKYGRADGSGRGWAAWHGSAPLGGDARLEANGTWRVRFDDTKNGSAAPEQAMVRLVTKQATVQWGDMAPSLASGAPLLASAVPRRGAQGTWTGAGIGTIEAYVAMEAHPRSAGGAARELRSDLYAARLSRSVGTRVNLTAYGGYTHEDPTPGGLEATTRARAIYGGSGSVSLPHGWRWLGDAATVRHRAIEGVETGRSRTGVRSELSGRLAGADVRAEGFQYQPDMATALNPYAISDRRGATLSLGRSVGTIWRLFGDYRFEEPVERIGPLMTPFGPMGGVPYVSVERLALGTRVALGPGSSVTPILIRVRHRGAQTELTEKRLSSELTVEEAMGGRTTARVDVALFDDDLGLAQKRKLVSGSLVTTRRQTKSLTSTLAFGIENDDHSELGRTDRTVQGTFELRWEALPGRLLFSPYLVYTDRGLETLGLSETLVSGRLQVAVVRIPFLADGAVAVEGRLNQSDRKEPFERKATEGAVSLIISQRVPLVR